MLPASWACPSLFRGRVCLPALRGRGWQGKVVESRGALSGISIPSSPAPLVSRERMGFVWERVGPGLGDVQSRVSGAGT